MVPGEQNKTLNSAEEGEIVEAIKRVEDVAGSLVDLSSSTSSAVIKEIAEVSGNVATSAKGAVDGAIVAAKESGASSTGAASTATSAVTKGDPPTISNDKSSFMALLRYLGYLLPGNYLKTVFFLKFVARPRRIIRDALWAFYRMEHIYDVLYEARRDYAGTFSILEFGTNEGYAFRKMLYATRFTGMEERVTVHGFDTFEGMPNTDDSRDLNIMTGKHQWIAGQFRGGKSKLEKYSRDRYRNLALHEGLFEESINEVFLQEIATNKPILVWFDADYYSSTVSAIAKILPIFQMDVSFISTSTSSVMDHDSRAKHAWFMKLTTDCSATTSSSYWIQDYL